MAERRERRERTAGAVMNGMTNGVNFHANGMNQRYEWREQRERHGCLAGTASTNNEQRERRRTVAGTGNGRRAHGM
jgi:hypothetical protein